MNVRGIISALVELHEDQFTCLGKTPGGTSFELYINDAGFLTVAWGHPQETAIIGNIDQRTSLSALRNLIGATISKKPYRCTSDLCWNP